MEGTSSTMTTISTTPTDPVSSLRAAALSTLKSKRRKPQVDRTTLPIPGRPPPPSDVFQLDYGAEDTPQDIVMTELAASPALPLAESSPQTISAQQTAREEGEISEEEETAKPPSRKRSTPRAVSSAAKRSTPDIRPTSEPSQKPVLQTSKEPPPDPKPLVPTAKVRDTSLVSVPPPLPSTTNHQLRNAVFSRPVPLDPNCVRPGLYLNQEQYDTVKEIVLDLLGWGVSPSHLVDCGVSREAIYYVFSELSLAFPEDFDVSGLMPYGPQIPTRSLKLTPMSPPPLSEIWGPAEMALHRDSPMMVPVAKTKVSPGVSQSADPPPTVDLHDIERQRRQELLARKAVQASRKLRQSISIDSPKGVFVSPVTSEGPAIPSTPSAVAVDDFLNSIGSVPHSGNNESSSAESSEPQAISNNNKDVRDPNGTSLSSDGFATPPPLSADTNHSSTSGGVPPTSGSSSTFSQMSDSDSGTVRTDAEPALVLPHRISKRPVATDFDFDAVPRGNGSAHLPLSKQPRTAFGSIASRRCVIDLSDSEGEEDGLIQILPQTTVDLHGRFGELRGKVLSPISTKPSTPGTPLTPSILLQKELEIRKMRELIAQREEETRLKKLAAKAAVNSAVATTLNGEVVVPIAQPHPRFKVEDVDIVMSSPEETHAELMTRRSSESASPPGEISEASLPVTRSITKSPTVTQHGQHPSNSVTPHEPDLSVAVARKVEPLPHQHSMFSLVDVDMLPSSSAQMNKSPTITSALQKQDERKLSTSETSQELLGDDNLESEAACNFANYQSPFDSYPLLRTSSLLIHHHPVQSFMSPNFLPSATPSFPSFVPDLKPLRLSMLGKRLDPLKRLCRYEIPGGGTCRDHQCEDTHLSRLEGINSLGNIEPTDIEAADFIFSVLPGDWLATFRVQSSSRIHQALHQVGHQTANCSLSLEDKVAKAMALIVSSSITT